ncbi:MAG: lysylphosphatidylglycerol synthase transmembrane domain-containing protein, partial [Gemmatimonadota bacterium]
WGGWRWAVGAGLLALLIAFVDPRELVATLRGASPTGLLAVAALSLAWLFAGALNVFWLLRSLAPVRLPTFLRVYVTSWAGSLILPGQLGDATQVWLLRRHGVPASSSGAAYVVDKALSLGWLTLVAAYGIGRYAPQIPTWWLPTLLLLAMAAAAVALPLLRRLPVPSTRWAARLHRAAGRLLEEASSFRRRPAAVARNLGVTIAKWVLMTLLYFAAFDAFGRPIPLEAAATIPVMSSLVGYLPVTVGGAGTIEWTAVFLFGRIGAEEATVLSVYLVLRTVLLLSAVLLVATLRGRVKIAEEG